MFETEQEKIRIDKLNKIKDLGIIPYPYKFDITHNIKDLRTNSENFIKKNEHIRIAGRIISIRKHGKITFIDLQDSEDKIQLYFTTELQTSCLDLRLLDIGDFIGVEGKLFYTKTHELTILVEKFVLLSKSIHPLPEKWHKIQDEELRRRKRFLDLIMQPQNKEVFIKRTKIINTIREFLNKEGFLEVETPVLQPLYGGAFATPFKCRYKALDCEYYLRISDELYLKRLIIAGFDKVYEIGKDFRNEGMDRFHNPEFTLLELYQAYADYNDMMEITKKIFELLTEGKEIEYQGNKISFKKWDKITYFDAIKKWSGEDLYNKDLEYIKKFAQKKGLQVEEDIKILDKIFENFVQPNLIQPTFIIDYPKEMSPLAKEHRKDKKLVERFEPFICGMEVGNAFTELNDPQEQLKRFEDLQKQKGETHPIDKDFIEAMSYGMPPTGGLGLSIDKITMLLTNTYSIKDVILFTQLRP